MANFGTNPWSLDSTDVASAAITGATGLTLNADGTVTITCGALTFNTNGVPPANWFTVINATNALYNGEYLRLTGASGGTAFIMQPLFNIPAGTAQSGSGTIAQCLWPWNVRVEDLSWQGLTGLGASGSLDLRDRMGNPLWRAAFLNNTGSDGYQNRGKLYWVEGITPITIAANTTVIATIN
jgi:hypothetical protein